MRPALATIAEYYRLALIAGLLQSDDAKDWAMSLIEQLAEPPGDIIELSWSKGVTMTMENLAAVQGDRDQQLAAYWLLASLRQADQSTDEALQRVGKQAMRIAQAAGLDEAVYFRFDEIDDFLTLARSNTCGTVAECRKELADALAEYPSMPVLSET